MRKLGVGMAGYGFIGRVHAHAHRSLPLFYRPIPFQTELLGVATSTESSGRMAQEEAGFHFHTRDYRDLLHHPDIDIIDVCTPNDTHFDICRDAILAGKHVYCDKPLALNVQQAEELAAMAESSTVVCQMTFNYRFVPAIMRARQLVESNLLGKLTGFRASYLHAGYIDSTRKHSWRVSKVRSGGGAIADLGSHAVDLLRFLTGPGSNVERGGEWESVSATLQTLIPKRPDAAGQPVAVDVDDIAIAQVRLSGGALGTLEASRLATGAQDNLKVQLFGLKGSLAFDLMEPNWLDVYDAREPEGELGGNRGMKRIEAVARYPQPYSLGVTKNTVGWLQFHIQCLFDLVNSIDRKERALPPSAYSPTFKDGLAVQRIICGVQQSAATGSAWTSLQ